MEEERKMGKYKDLSHFDKGPIVMARRPDQGIFKSPDLVACSQHSVVSTYQNCTRDRVKSTKGSLTNVGSEN